MDIFGNPIEGDNLSNGGVIDGNLEITGNGQIDGDLVVAGTITAHTIITEEELEVKDPLITCGVGAPDDTRNLGILEEYSDGSLKYAGVVRSKDDKKQYLLEGVTPKPLPSTNITGLPRGDLVMKDLTASAIDCTVSKAVSLEMKDSGGVTQWFLGPDNVTKELELFNQSVDKIISVTQAGLAKFPTVEAEDTFRLTGTSAAWDIGHDGYYLTFTCDDDETQARWRLGSYTFQTYDSGAGGGQIALERGRGTVSVPTPLLAGDTISTITWNGRSSSGLNTAAQISCTAVDDYSVPGARGSDIIFNTITLGSNVIEQRLKLDSSGVSVGTDAAGYKLPPTRGTAGQILQDVAGNGAVTWQDLPEFTGSYGLQYFLNNTVTPSGITVVNTYVDVVGNARLDGELNDFTTQANSMTYTGADTQMFKLEFSCNWQADGNQAELYELAFHKNGVVIPAGEMTGRLDNTSGNYPRNITTMTFVQLATNDIITIKVRNTESTQDVIFSDMVFSAHAIDNVSGSGGSGSLQQAYDVSSSPQITTSVANGALLIKQGVNAVGGLEILDSSDTQAVLLGADGQVYASSGLTVGVSPNTYNINSDGADLLIETQGGDQFLRHTGNDLTLGETLGNVTVRGLVTTIESLSQVNQLASNGVDGYTKLIKRARGTLSAPTALLADDEIANLRFDGYEGTAYIDCANIKVLANAPFSGTTSESRMEFWGTKPDETAPVKHAELNSTGSLLTNVSEFTNGALVGGIIAKKITTTNPPQIETVVFDYGSAVTSWRVGDRLRCKIWGQTSTTIAGQLQVKLTINNSALSSGFNNVPNAANQSWCAEFDLVFRAVGVGGEYSGCARFLTGDSTAASEFVNVQTATAIDTTNPTNNLSVSTNLTGTGTITVTGGFMEYN